MFSNVGPISHGSGGPIVSSQTQPTTSPGADARSAARGEAGAAALRAETAERVDPPKQTGPVAGPSQEPRRMSAPDEVSISQRLAEVVARITPLPEPEPQFPSPDVPDPLDDAAPAGPPPAFRRSLLEAQRSETVAPDPAPAIVSAPEPPDQAATRPTEVAEATPTDPIPAAADDPPAAPAEAEAEDDPLIATIRRLMTESPVPSVPPTPEARADAEFSSLRRMAAPYDTATVDVSR